MLPIGVLFVAEDSARAPELGIETAELTVCTHSKRHEQLPCALSIVLVEQSIQGLVEPIALNQHDGCAPGHARLHRLYIDANLRHTPRHKRGKMKRPMRIIHTAVLVAVSPVHVGLEWVFNVFFGTLLTSTNQSIPDNPWPQILGPRGRATLAGVRPCSCYRATGSTTPSCSPAVRPSFLTPALARSVARQNRP